MLTASRLKMVNWPVFGLSPRSYPELLQTASTKRFVVMGQKVGMRLCPDPQLTAGR